MCSAAFYYPAEQIFKASKDALARRGFRILEEDRDRGYLKAKSKFSFFRKAQSVELNIVTQDAISTLNLRATDNYIFSRDDKERFNFEQRLIDTVYKLVRVRDVN